MGPDELVDDPAALGGLEVIGPTSTGDQPRGKQTLEPRGIWYTAVSGIWQTVWLEPVSALYICDVRAVHEIEKGELSVDVALSNTASTDDAVPHTARDQRTGIATTIHP